ncbi:MULTISPECIES: GumC family protein [Methylosinus]|uniref:GumC family protein n=1 Tax=Methylosinus TaxID=425 RepID=UPI0002F04D4B|nr:MULTISPECIES: polysaccharide biosynthesis tyrosine autokinase [Methylosinus]OBS50482.1 capsular biosynthesis protein [Methylosinus sp. 3S-1]
MAVLERRSDEHSLAAAASFYPGLRDDRFDSYAGDSETPLFFKLIDLVLKYKRDIALICTGFLVAGLIVTFLMPRIFTATTTIQIDREATKFLRNHDAVVEDHSDPQFYETQHELLKSRALAERVVSSLSLADRKGFLETDSWSLTRAIGAIFSSKGRETPDPEQQRQRAIDTVMYGLSIQPIARSRIVRVQFGSRDPAIAQAVSAAVGQDFVAMTLDRRYAASAYARMFLQEKLQQVKLKLEDSEKQVVQYAQKEGIVNVDDKISTAGANLRSLNDSLAGATAERIRSERLWLQAQEGNGVGLPQVLDDRNIQSARERRTQLTAAFQEKLRVMKPDFPEMQQLRAQIVEYDHQISSQVSLIKRAIKARYEAARDQELSFREQIEKLKTEVLDLRNRSIQYNILQREVDTNRTLYEGLLQQYKEVGITGAIGTNNVAIIDKAELPKVPSSPKLLLNLALALVLGLLASAAAVLVRESLDDTVKAPEEIEEMLGLAVLGVIPVCEQAPGDTLARRVITEPYSAAAEAFRSLGTSLQFATESGVPKTLLVTSSQPSEGKSTTSACLAGSFGQLGMRVLLIDADMRRPSMHTIFGVENRAGLVDVLKGLAYAEDIVIENCARGVTLLAAGSSPCNPPELLSNPRMGTLLATARENFDVVIVDSPPVVGLADAPLIGSFVDGAILVVGSNCARRRSIRAAVKRLRFSRTRLVGSVLTRFDPSKVGRAYGYGFGSDAYNSYYYERERLPADHENRDVEDTSAVKDH